MSVSVRLKMPVLYHCSITLQTKKLQNYELLIIKRWNDFSGWLVFLIAAFVYGMTIEPTASFWDCPEFISCAEKLQVGHPPGAPFYMLVGNLFTQFASDPSQVSRTVNFLNALLSAGCILFLFGVSLAWSDLF